jgi:thiol-disulfide isomerase/thioredoxin
MKFGKFLTLAIFTAFIAVLSAVNIPAQEMSKKTETEKPIVAVIKADWCSYCKQVEPVLAKLMEEYSEKLNFVVFDVTNDETAANSKEKAEAFGLSDFFGEYKSKTSAVAVFKNKEIVYKTSNNNRREDYVKAFEKALK